MKQFITFFALVFSYMLCGAQSTTLTVDNKVAGTLSQRILYDDKLTVKNLFITGELDGDDLKFIQELNSSYKLTGTLDVSEANLTGSYSYGNGTFSVLTNNINVKAFRTYKRLNKLVLPKSATKWTESACFSSSAGITHLNVDSLIILEPKFTAIGGVGNPSYLYIGEGVETFYVNNSEGGEKYSGTVEFDLPSSLKSIYITSSKVGNPDFITVHANMLSIPRGYGNSNGNTPSKEELAFFAKGIAYVPEGTKAIYQNSMFKNLEIIAPVSVAEISLDNTSVRMKVGETCKLSATIYPTDADNKSIIWQSSNPDVASVDTQGNITSLSRGVAIITAMSEENVSIYASCTLNVEQQVTGISLSESELTLEKGTSYQLTAQIHPDNANNKNVLWYSTNEVVATVSDKGVITALKPGQVVIKVETMDGNFTANCLLTIIQPVESVSVSPKTLTINVGENNTIIATVLPTNANDKSITWTSSDEEIVMVNGDGMILGINPGEAKITAYSNFNSEISDVCIVTVLLPVSGITLDKSQVEIVEDESIQLRATILPENASNKNVNWTSSDISIAMVSPDGTVYAIKAGQATIMATTADGGFVALCKVTVIPKTISISSIELSTNSETLAVGETLQLNAIVSPKNASNKSVNWTSTSPSIAIVNATGLVTAIAEGETQIVATTTDGSNLSAICNISVQKRFISISQIQIAPSSVKIAVGKTMNLNVLIEPEDATNKTVKWSSTNPSVVTVSDVGVISAISDGNAVIIASSQDGTNLSATCQVEVFTEAVLVESINLNSTKIEGAVNDTYEIEAVVLPSNSSNKSIKWSSSDGNVASVDNGIVKLLALGTSIITAESTDGSNVKSECTVIVSHEAGIDSIIMDKDTNVKIYNLCGFLVYEGIYSEANLTPGFYIIMCNGASYKTKVD